MIRLSTALMLLTGVAMSGIFTGPVLASGESAALHLNNELKAFNAKASPAVCTPPPTQDQINTAPMTYQDFYMSAKRAASLGIPIINANAATDYLVIVRDYRRYKSCTATDGKTEIYYGQVIRAVLELTKYDATTSLALSSIAANITLSGQQQYFYLYRTGWYNPDVDKIIADVSGKVFNVENYALYQNAMPRMIDLLSSAATTFAAEPILTIPPDDDPNFAMASTRAYAFSQAANGRSCVDACKRFAADAARSAAVVDGYAFLGKPGCTSDSTVEPARSRAETLLGGLKVK